MQTFLVSRSFLHTAQVLDNKRLGKQRVETLQILNTLTGRSKGWANHPAVKMWRGHEGALIRYGEAMIGEWKHRGFKNTMSLYAEFWEIDANSPEPPWMLDDRSERVFASHRANLLRKDPIFYGLCGWTEDPAMPYFWPLEET